MPDPAQIIQAIDEGCAELDQVTKDLDVVLEAYDLAQAEYEATFEAELAVLVEEYEQRKARLPGEEVRRALIHQRIDRGLYREVKRCENLRRRLESKGDRVAKALSGRQSELKFLTAEGLAPNGRQQPSWSNRRAGW